MKSILHNSINRCLVLFCSFLFFSCNTQEEIWLNKKGDGRYKYTVETTKESGSMLLSQLSQKNESASDLSSWILFDAMDRSIDTSMSAKNFFDTLIRQPIYPAVFEKTKIYIKSDMDKSYIQFSLEIRFRNIRELNEGISNLWALKNFTTYAPFDDPVKLYPFFEYSNDILKRNKIEDYSSMDGISQNDMSMAELLFKESEHKIVYHLASKPLEVSYKDAVINDKNDVIVSFLQLDILAGKKEVTGQIRLK